MNILCYHQSTTVYVVETVGNDPLLPTVVYVQLLLIPAEDYFMLSRANNGYF